MTQNIVFAKIAAGKGSGLSAMSARWIECRAGDAGLTVVGVPDDVSVPSVLRHLNDTCIAQPYGSRDVVRYDDLGRGRWLNLYRRATT